MAQMTALRRRMIDDVTVRNLSPATQQSYRLRGRCRPRSAYPSMKGIR
jgi:hypothetical protein